MEKQPTELFDKLKQTDQGIMSSLHVCYKGQEHEAKIASEEVLVQSWFSVWAESPMASWTSRLGFTQIRNCYFRKRLFLAWS